MSKKPKEKRKNNEKAKEQQKRKKRIRKSIKEDDKNAKYRYQKCGQNEVIFKIEILYIIKYVPCY